ncbi:MAG TPA: alpha/beta hydrolase [Allosphingosinicella sp.]|jgi:pimeloyl-ACP methyl ester carboxylesterase
MRLLLIVAAALLLTPSRAPALSEEMTALSCASPEAPIEAQGFVPIGGIAQWVTVRGSACGNPILLFVHGGPGNPMSPFSANVFREWERDFTIVQWDQRGAGRTFGRNPATANDVLSLERMTQDGVEIAGFLARSLGQDRVVLIGTSWGSALGVHMALARPDLFHAYVGVSQLVQYRANQEESYRSLLARARAARDGETVSAIEALGPPPWTNPRYFGVLRRAIRRYERHATDPAPDSWWVPAPLYATPEAAAAYEAGEDYSFLQFVGAAGDGLYSRIDLPALGRRFAIPVFLVQGSEDLLTVPGVSRRYFEYLTAPTKSFVLVPRAGHDPNPAMLDAVRSLLLQHAPSWRSAGGAAAN